MYLPKSFEPPSREAMLTLMRECPLATLITHGADELIVNHIPMLLSATDAENGKLACHIARANSVWRESDLTKPVVAVFQDVNTYITPSWYATKQESGKVVPTWNYAVVHAHGKMRIIEDHDWLMTHLNQITDHNEQPFDKPWQVSDAPRDFIENLARAVVGIEISITRLEGKWKVSQNRPEADRDGVAQNLARGDTNSQRMARLVATQN
jgi:transcriptional regulator